MIRPEDRAPITDNFELYIDAFHELRTCAPTGFGPAPIPFTAVVEYSKIYNIEDFDEFLFFIRAMDRELLALEEQEQKSKKPNGTTDASKKN